MAIRISHGKASTIAQFGIEAGKGEQKVRQEAEAQTNARQSAAINAQLTATSMRINADINQSILDAQSRQEAMEFESFIKGESAKRTMAWGLEKMELSRQHDFEMNIQRKDLENQLSMDKDARGKAELDNKMGALDDAAERGDISQEDADQEKLRLRIGVSDRFSVLKPLTSEEQLYQDFIDQRKEAEATQADPLKRSVAALRSLTGTLNESDKKDVEAIIEEEDINKIKQTTDILEARAAIEKGPSIKKILTPIGAFSEILRLNRLKKQAGVPEETKRPQTAEFSPFRQSVGSFR